MTKRHVIFCLLFFLGTAYFGFAENQDLITLQPTSYRDLDCFRSISFYADNRVEFSDEEDWSSNNLWNRIFNYTISLKDKFYELSIQNETHSAKFLILLSNNYLIIYNENKTVLFKGVAGINIELVYFPSNIKVSSELKEGDIIYSGDNIMNLNPNTPWVEGQSGYGVGETISFEVNCQELIFFNGFVSNNKSYLYLQNSRIKIIEIFFLRDNTSKIYNLEDTPNPQSIIFDNPYSGELLIKIMDIYKGTKYSDTCLNGILIRH